LQFPPFTFLATPLRPKSVNLAYSASDMLQDTPVTFDVVYANVGDAFDVYSSHFVCTVNATYLFAAHVLGQNGL